MKKIITAMDNNRLAEEINKTGMFELVTRDIPYKEGILELLNEIPKIDIIIVSEILEGQIEFKELIKKILQKNAKIEMIVFLEEKNSEIQNFLFSNGIYKIYQNNEIDLENFIEILSGDTRKPDLEYINNEMLKIREIIKRQNNLDNINLEERGKVIAFSGAYNTGKSLLTCVLGNEYSKKDVKTLIIDFDTYNGSINTLFNIKKYNDDIINIENQIIHVSANLDVICVMDLLFNNDNKVDYVNLEEMIKKFKIKYDVILIDTTSNYKYKYLSRILNISDKIIFLVIPSILELKKSFNLFEIISEDFKINKNKIKIILNKVNDFSVDNNIIQKMFGNIEMLGQVKYDESLEKNTVNRKKNNLIRISEIIGE